MKTKRLLQVAIAVQIVALIVIGVAAYGNPDGHSIASVSTQVTLLPVLLILYRREKDK